MCCSVFLNSPISGSIAHTCARLGRDGCVWISSKLSKATSLSSYSVDLVTRNEMGDMVSLYSILRLRPYYPPIVLSIG